MKRVRKVWRRCEGDTIREANMEFRGLVLVGVGLKFRIRRGG